MKRAILSLFLALCLFFSTAPAQAASAGYSDIPSGHWSEESVARATELGLFQGVGDGLFGRGQPITRAAFVTALVRLFGWDEVSPSTPAFTDVEPHRWFYAAVETALANGAVTATSRTFRPTDNITREEMAVMLVRALGYASLAGTASGYSSPFTDMTTNRGYITIAYDLGIVGGVGDGRFAPDQTATREQAAAMLVRVYDRLYARLHPPGLLRQPRSDHCGYSPGIRRPVCSHHTLGAYRGALRHPAGDEKPGVGPLRRGAVPHRRRRADAGIQRGAPLHRQSLRRRGVGDPGPGRDQDLLLRAV